MYENYAHDFLAILVLVHHSYSVAVLLLFLIYICVGLILWSYVVLYWCWYINCVIGSNVLIVIKIMCFGWLHPYLKRKEYLKCHMEVEMYLTLIYSLKPFAIWFSHEVFSFVQLQWRWKSFKCHYPHSPQKICDYWCMVLFFIIMKISFFSAVVCWGFKGFKICLDVSYYPILCSFCSQICLCADLVYFNPLSIWKQCLNYSFWFLIFCRLVNTSICMLALVFSLANFFRKRLLRSVILICIYLVIIVSHLWYWNFFFPFRSCRDSRKRLYILQFRGVNF